MNYNECITFYDLPVSPAEFTMVLGAKPSGALMSTKGLSCQSPASLPKLSDTSCGKMCFSSTRKNNKAVRTFFQQEIPTKPYIFTYWSTFSPSIPWKKVWTFPDKYFITNKIKDISFRILHRFYPAKHYLTKFKKILM